MRSPLRPASLAALVLTGLASALAVGAPARAVEPPCLPGEATAAPCEQALPSPCGPSTDPCEG
jgi:hypothetical protein